jgi:hypothetical protein
MAFMDGNMFFRTVYTVGAERKNKIECPSTLSNACNLSVLGYM